MSRIRDISIIKGLQFRIASEERHDNLLVLLIQVMKSIREFLRQRSSVHFNVHERIKDVVRVDYRVVREDSREVEPLSKVIVVDTSRHTFNDWLLQISL